MIEAMNTRIVLSLSLLAAGALTTSAGPLQRADLPADPAWVLHVDCDALRPSTIGQYLLSELEKPDAQEQFAAIQAIFSFDPRTQLHGLTLFSAGTTPADGVLLAHADIDPDRLIVLAKAAKDYQTTTHNGLVIHSWIDDKKPAVNDVKPRTYAALFNRNVIVFGQKESTVAQTLDVLARKVPSLAADSAFAQLCAGGDNSFVQAMARKIELPNNDPNAAVFRLAKLIRLKIGEASRQITASLVLEANDDQIANQITSIVQGLTSLLKLQDKKPEAAKLANALTIHQSGVSVTVNLSLPADDVVGMMKADAAKKALKNAETKIQTH
jgi:hypothetical protein